MSSVSKRRKAPKRRESGIREVLEVRTGKNLDFAGFIVVEKVNGVERILGFAQGTGDFGFYKNEDEEKRDRTILLREAERAYEDPEHIGRSKWIIDYRRFGLPTSTEQMPIGVYDWTVYTPGRFHNGKESGRQLFPYCPIRLAEMEKARYSLGGPAAASTGESDYEITTLGVGGTSDTWEILEHGDDLIVFQCDGDNNDKDELVVLDAENLTIHVPGSYSPEDLGIAIAKALEISRDSSRKV